MSFSGTGTIWMNGKLVEWKDATIHIASHVIHYGSGVFEGARCYATPKGSAVFRLDEHLVRLVNSAKIYRMEYPLDLAGWRDAVLGTIRANQMKACYIRPLVYRGYDTLGVNPLPNPVDAAIMLWEWGAYLGPDALEQGTDVKVSSWSRMAPEHPAGDGEEHRELRELAADQDGSARRRLLRGDRARRVRQRQRRQRTEHLLVRDGILYTPPISASVLGGITRDSIMTLARDLGYQVVEANLPRESLYIADEVFFTGTAAEVTPIRTIDKITIGSGKRGPITAALQSAFFAVVNGDVPDTHGWLTYVYADEAALREPAKAGAAKG